MAMEHFIEPGFDLLGLLSHDKSDGSLAPFSVWPANNHGLLNHWVLEEDILDATWVDVLSTGDDQ